MLDEVGISDVKKIFDDCGVFVEISSEGRSLPFLPLMRRRIAILAEKTD